MTEDELTAVKNTCALLDEAMSLTGTGTAHYHKIREARERLRIFIEKDIDVRGEYVKDKALAENVKSFAETLRGLRK